MVLSLMKHSKVRGAYCLGVFQNGKDLTTLLGGILFTCHSILVLPFHDLHSHEYLLFYSSCIRQLAS